MDDGVAVFDDSPKIPVLLRPGGTMVLAEDLGAGPKDRTGARVVYGDKQLEGGSEEAGDWTGEQQVRK